MLWSTFGWDSYPIEVTCEFLGDVGLSSSGQSDHHDHRWRVCHVRSPCCAGKRCKELNVKVKCKSYLTHNQHYNREKHVLNRHASAAHTPEQPVLYN